ncbi:sterol desaturase family [Aspergillus steynii IBT 23096]|uniref:Sterol desaturase family n=1 Tax=Aspergillus steynii IBT 23096 TaxID=1392250 RepID=A0A2I2FT42_9EURO|nr:sterol desaturase family [Aspergillus steynii IBT 23096]PLB43786.1 sterol desaturase family [Aspergillus steynii IBT 23096]
MLDALFSLPIMTILLIPALSSYRTTLNFIFFYMTWTTLVLSHTPLRVELFGTVAVRVIFCFVPSLLFFLFDILTPSAAAVIKVHGEAGLPSGGKRARLRREIFKVAGWSLLNIFLSVAVQAAIEKLRIDGMRMRSAVKVSIKLPMPFEIFKGLLVTLLVREVLTYIIHRYILHSRDRRVSFITKTHRNWYHTLRVPFPLTAHYDHPALYLLGTFIPTYVPVALFRIHMLTYLFYMALVSLEETFAFSGYSVMPGKFILGGIARRTEIHLFTNDSNFGRWGLVDWICGTLTVDDDDEDGGHRRELADKVQRAVDESTSRKFYERSRLKKKGN